MKYYSLFIVMMLPLSSYSRGMTLRLLSHVTSFDGTQS